MGWYMVKSGLEDRFHGPSDVPRVSQYRLAAHLSLAFILYAGLLGGALRVLRPFPAAATLQKIKELKSITGLAHAVKAMTFITAVSGQSRVYSLVCLSVCSGCQVKRGHRTWLEIDLTSGGSLPSIAV